MRSAGAPCADLAPTTAHRLLADERRLAVVVAVAEADGRLSSNALARMLAARERESSPDEVDPQVARRLRENLQTEHIPTLVDNEIIVATDEGYRPGPNLPGLVAIVEAAWEHLCPSG